MHEITYLSQELDKINPNSIGKYHSLDTIGCSKRLWNMLCEPHLDSLDILSLNLSQEEASFLLNNWSKIKFNHDSLFYRHARDLEYIYSEQTLYNSILNLIKISLEPYQIEEIQKFNLLDYFPLDVNEYYECAANSDSALSNEVHRIFDKLDKTFKSIAIISTHKTSFLNLYSYMSLSYQKKTLLLLSKDGSPAYFVYLCLF